MALNSLHIVLALLVLGLTALLFFNRRQQRHHQATLDQLPVGLCTVGGAGQVTLWNSQMAALTGVSVQDASGRTLESLPEPWRTALRESLEDRGGDVIKRPITGPDDNDRWVIMHSSAQGNAMGERAVLVEDISDYQTVQDKLLHKERLASIGRLAAGVAHEIGNPITGIACLAQNLGELGEGAEVVQSADEILKQTDRISRIVNSLVQFSHSGGERQAIDLVPCNLADCVDEAIHLLSLDRDASRDSFSNCCDRELLVLGDNQLLLQVFVNLLDNARSASPAQEVVLVEAKIDGGTVVVHVDNSGEVIAPDVLARLFEPFFTTKEVGMGTGLGLPLVRGMLEDMGGDIELVSPRPGADGTRAQLQLARTEYSADLIGA